MRFDGIQIPSPDRQKYKQMMNLKTHMKGL